MSNYSSFFQKGLSYGAYKQLIIDLLENHKTTGNDHSEDMLHYTKMNLQRMNRVEKTAELTTDIQAWASQVKSPLQFLVISEGWCGDAAQIVPVIHKIVELNPEKLSLKLVLRDEDTSLIDAHLTNGGRSIPVLLVLNESGELLAEKWGPRPQILQDLLQEWKTEGVVMPELAEKLHGWYAKDKTMSTQESLLTYFKGL